MKKTYVSLSLIICFLLISTVIYSNEDTAIRIYDPVGLWNLEIELPGSTAKGTINISKNEEGEFVVTLSDANTDESVQLEEVSFEGDVMTGEFEAEGVTAEVTLNFNGDSLEGTMLAGGAEITMTGERETE